MRKILILLAVFCCSCWAEDFDLKNIPTAPPGTAPPATTTTSTVPTVPTAPPGGQPTTTPPGEQTPTTTTPPPGEQTTTTTTDTTTTPTTPTTTTTTQAPPPPEPTPAPPECPSTGVVNLPTEHCQYFISCINGNEMLLRCQDGFLFDTVRGNCEVATIVDCGTRHRP